MATLGSEAEALLTEEPAAHVEPKQDETHIWRVLPIAFTAAFGMAATSATSIYAYASITCADPSNCKDAEKNRYAAVVATATTIASTFGVVAVCVMRHWTEAHPKLGLCIWLVSRSLGVGMLAIGVFFRSIHIAVAGRIFEGLANDNMLHYTLAAVYIKTSDSATFSQLMGTSLALYMTGMAISPAAVTLLPNFTQSFLVAIAILGASLLYLAAFVHVKGEKDDAKDAGDAPFSVLAPLRYLVKDRRFILPALAILLFNVSQAYLFPLIMVHAALKFGFGSDENGYIVSLAACTTSIYLFMVLYGVKNTRQDVVQRDADQAPDRRALSRDLFYALLSMSTHLVVLPCFIIIQKANMVYVLVVLVAFGLAAPSFIKSYAVTTARDKNLALSVVAIMESLGGLLSPVILGSVQAWIGQGAFGVASGFVGMAMLGLVGSIALKRRF